MRRSDPARGFTLLEVLIALTIFSMVMGMLLQTVSQNIRALSSAEREIELMELAHDRIRQIQAEAGTGQIPELGDSAGAFNPPWEDLRWELLVERFAMPLPEDLSLARVQRAEESSPVFGDGEGVGDSPLRLVVLRVYDEFGNELIDPFVVLAAEASPGGPQ